MVPIKFTVNGKPIPQPRQRHRVIRKKLGGVMIGNYTPAKHPVNGFKDAVRSAFCLAVNGYDHSEIPTTRAVSLRLVFWMPRPKNETRKRSPNPSYPHAKKPDVDNLCKSVLDALTGLAWRDDSQVAEIAASKIVCSGDDEPRLCCEIMEVTK